MIGLLRYSLSDVVHAQRWVAPVVIFSALDAVISVESASVLPTLAALATVLVFIATWLTVVIVNNEDPVQQSITETCAGSRARVRLSKLLLSYLLVVALAALGMVAPVCLAGRATAGDLLAGLFAQLMAALAGVSLGALCSRPIIRRRAWSVLIGMVVGLATVLLPSGVPSRQLLVLFNKTGQFALGLPLLWIGIETLVLCAIALAASLRLSLARS